MVQIKFEKSDPRLIYDLDGQFLDPIPPSDAQGLRIFAVNPYSVTGKELELSTDYNGNTQSAAYSVTFYNDWINAEKINNGGTEQALEYGSIITDTSGLKGTIYDDSFFGHSAQDVFWAGDGNDYLGGGGGDDYLDGGAGRDTLDGGSGNDTLVSNGGNNTLTGGFGTDTFVVTNAESHTKITDFKADQDKLLLVGDYDLAALLEAATESTRGGIDRVNFNLGDGRTIQLQNTKISHLSEDNIIIDKDGSLSQSLSPVEDIHTETPYDLLDAGGSDYSAGDAAGEGLTIKAINGWDETGKDLSVDTGTATDAVTQAYSISARSDAATYQELSSGLDTALQHSDIVTNTTAITGSSYNDSFSGRGANDHFNGADGNDRLLGGDGNDTLIGGAGRDRLIGGAGDDILDADQGNDWLTGGKGLDLFVITPDSDGHTIIDDFDLASDTIAFKTDTMTMDDIETHAAQIFADGVPSVVISFSDSSSVTIKGIQLSDLTEGHFALTDADYVTRALDTETEPEPAPEPAPTPPPVDESEPAPIPDETTGGGDAVEDAFDLADGVGGAINAHAGINLAGVNFYNDQHAFINVFKSARPWRGDTAEQNNAISYEELEATGAFDENGYPTQLPEGVTGVYATMLLDTDTNYERTHGTFRLKYEGNGEIEIKGAVKGSIEYHDGYITFDRAPDSFGIGVRILSTDPDGTGDYIRDISVVHEDFTDLYDAGEIFNPDWVDLIDDFSTLRFMNWMKTNNSQVDSWEDVASESHAFYDTISGVPVEVMVALANKTGVDPWFTIPHMADDAYVQEFAAYVRDNLDPALKAHFEYSNEIWNWSFGQTHYAREQGKLLFGEDASAPHHKYYGYRSTEVAEIIEDTFGASADSRVVNVLATQTAAPHAAKHALGVEVTLNDGTVTTAGESGFFESLAITTYFKDSDYSVEELANILGIDPTDPNASLEGVSPENLQAAFNYHAANTSDEIDSRLVPDFLKQSETAETYGLDLITYEGGSHVVASGSDKSIDWLNKFFNEFNYSEQVVSLYEQVDAAFAEVGGTLQVNFLDVADSSKHGSWGHLRSLVDQNDRWDYVKSATEIVNLDGREEGTFDQGVYVFGSDADDILTGTNSEDSLIAGGGNDTIIAGFGSDKIHGGDGYDTLKLSGTLSDYDVARTGENTLTITGPDGETKTVVDVEELSFSGMEELVRTDIW